MDYQSALCSALIKCTGGGGGLNARGAWAASTAYAVNDWVTYGGQSFYRTTAETSGASFTSDSGWGLLAGTSDPTLPAGYIFGPAATGSNTCSAYLTSGALPSGSDGLYCDNNGVWSYFDVPSSTFKAVPQTVSQIRSLLDSVYAAAGSGVTTVAGRSGAVTLTNADVSGLGTAATANTGTSGATVPLMNTVNTWSAEQVINNRLKTNELSLAPATVTAASYTVNGIGTVFLVSAASNSVAFNLAAAQLEAGQIIIVKRTDANTMNYSVTINAPSGKTIDGAASYVLSTQNSVVAMLYDGTNLNVLFTH